MKPTKLDLQTASIVESNDFITMYLWSFLTQAGIKGEIKYLERKYAPGWCAYLFLTRDQLRKINFTEDENYYSYINSQFINGEITFFEIQRDGTYKIGWDYLSMSQTEENSSHTFELVKNDVENCAKEVIRLCKNSFL